MAIALGADKRFVLVIDAGHGGHDCGAKGSFSYEKNINLNVALAFGKYVEHNCPDVKVIFTRKTDIFIPLHKRAEIANKNKADVFISIHTNAVPSGHTARGIETYTMGMRRSEEKLSAAKRENSVIMIEKDYKEHYEGYDPNSPESTIMFEFMHDQNMSESVELARNIQKNLCISSGRQNKGVKQDVFLVLRETSMPACLIELGFITTPDEERMLNDERHIEQMAKGIYQGFINYRFKHNTNLVAPYIPTDNNTQKSARINRDTKTEEKNKDNKEAITSKQVVVLNNTKNKDLKKEIKQLNSNAEQGRPIFKIQILASSRALRPGSSQFKGLENIDYYKEGELTKYTYGASTDYNEINRLRKTILDKFPQAFIIAFKNGEKTNINQAIQEYKRTRK